jgi:hypothetical protein
VAASPSATTCPSDTSEGTVFGVHPDENATTKPGAPANRSPTRQGFFTVFLMVIGFLRNVAYETRLARG